MTVGMIAGPAVGGVLIAAPPALAGGVTFA